MNVAFRVDASRALGVGHVMRCLCLADLLRQRGATIRFLSRELPGYLAEMIADCGHELRVLDGTDDAGESTRALAPGVWDWMVVDHYDLDARWESALRPSARRILAIDDLANRPHDCDVLLDHNLVSDDQRYAPFVPATSLRLLGPRYALLRDEFVRARAHVRPRAGTITRVLISFGGTDPANLTGVAIEALVSVIPNIAHVDVVIGAGHPHQENIEAACGRHGFQLHVQTDRMAELMAAADLAIGAGGVTTWERCCLGLPALAVPVVANQKAHIAAAADEGVLAAVLDASSLASHLRALMASPSTLVEMSRAAFATVDGRGIERVARALDTVTTCVREATPDDAEALFTWRNHEAVRVMSHRSEPISWSEHQAWLRSVLADDDRFLLIGERDGLPVGVVRFDVVSQRADVSIYRVPGSQGAGLGASLLLAAEHWLGTRRPDVTTLAATVLADNARSHQLFKATGYRRASDGYEKDIRRS